LEVVRNKNLRYALPLVGVLAVLTAIGLQTLPDRVRRVALPALIVLGVLQVSAVMAGVPPNVRIPGLAVSWVPASPPERADWRHPEIPSVLERGRHRAPRPGS